MVISKGRNAAWLLLTFTLPTKRASQRVEVWRKLQRYGTVPLGNSGYLLPGNPVNEERFQWLATAIRKYGGDASIVQVRSIDNISTPQLIGRFAEARAGEYQELIRELQRFSSLPKQKRAWQRECLRPHASIRKITKTGSGSRDRGRAWTGLPLHG